MLLLFKILLSFDIFFCDTDLAFDIIVIFTFSGLNNVATLMSKDKVLRKKVKKEHADNHVEHHHHHHHHQNDHPGEHHHHHQNGHEHQHSHHDHGDQNNADHHHHHGYHHVPSHTMETEDDDDDDDDENVAVNADISEEGAEEYDQARSDILEEDKQAIQTVNDQAPASSELEERIPTLELTDEKADHDDPNYNGECNECPPSEHTEESGELILSPGFDHFRFLES